MKRFIPGLLVFTLLFGTFAWNTQSTSAQEKTIDATNVTERTNTSQTTPKYVFLFIGDGMTYPQVQASSYYLGARTNKSDIVKGGVELSFTNFPVAGSASTYDSTSFAPDSASTATSIATGNKTHSGVINMDESKTIKYTTIAEQLRDQKDFKIGVVSSVNINHATPAAFYAHQATRNNYYEIGQELVASDFDYFAGGGLLKSTGANGDLKDIYEIAKEAGYTVTRTQAEAEALTPASGKAIVIAEDLDSSSAMKYEIDRDENAWALKDYVSQGIEMLNNDTGFFMMVEGGKIDWAGHANDAASVVGDVLAMSDAVQVALDFAKKHPEETLILVTGDHETGGLSIGYAGTNYDTYLDNLQYQTISYSQFDAEYVAEYVKNGTSFEDVMKDVQKLFGLTMPENSANAPNETLILTDYEVSLLKDAYNYAINGFSDEKTQAQYIEYGTYNPFSVTVTHLLNNKSGISFTSYAHTGLPTAVYASGAGSDMFAGYYDNTDIYEKISTLLNVK